MAPSKNKTAQSCKPKSLGGQHAAQYQYVFMRIVLLYDINIKFNNKVISF